MDPEGYPVAFLWKVDDHNVSTSPSFSMYLKEGVHSISLTISDQNHSVTSSLAVIVTNRAPVMSVLLNGTSIPEDDVITVIENETLIFDASGSSDPDGGKLTFTWILDGETIGTGPQLILTLDGGYHQLRLTINDEDGRTATLIKGLNCIMKPEPDNNGTDKIDDDQKGVALSLYIIPSILIMVFLATAIVFFILSRGKKKDEYFEE